MFLTSAQIAELLQIVNIYSTTFLANTVGTEILTPEDKLLLRSQGFSLDQVNNASTDTAQAFKFGLISMALGDSTAKSMTYSQFKSHLKSGRYFPLSDVEKGALTRVKQQVANETRRLSGNMQRDIENSLVTIDRGRPVHSKGVLSAAQETIKNRESVAQLAGDLGRLSGQWDRDLGRMADYVLHDAFNEGRLAGIERGNGKVYFDVYPGACKHCIRLYLSAGPQSEPIIFTPDELRANGSNAGKKVDQWKATIGPIHPWCRCTASEKPEGFSWNPVTRDFSNPDPSFERRVRRRSRVNVTVGDTTTEI